MWCTKCNRDISECTCDDIKERIARANESPHVLIRVCLKCGEHYSRCKCTKPEWNIKLTKEMHPDDIGPDTAITQFPKEADND